MYCIQATASFSLRILAVTFLLCLVACAGTISTNSNFNTELITNTVATPKYRAFNSDSMYDLLLAEFALRRGTSEQAAHLYYDQAKTQQDIQLAEHATRTAYALEKYDLAIQSADLWLSMAHNNPEALGIKAIALFNSQQPSNINDLLASNAQITNTTVFSHLALNAETTQQQWKLLQLFQPLVEKYPASSNLLIGTAYLYHITNNSKQAQTLMKRALEKDQSIDTLLLNFKISTADTKTKALQKLKTFLSSNKNSSSAQESVLSVLAEEDPEFALNFINTLLAKGPQPYLLLQLANVNIKLNKLRNADVILQRLLLSPGYKTQAHYLLGIVKRKQDLDRQAIPHFFLAQEDDFLIPATESLVATLIDLNEPAAAFAEFKNARSKAQKPSENLHFFLLEASLYNQLNAYDQAIKILNTAAIFFPNHPRILYNRALIHFKFNNADAAVYDLKIILKENPKDAPALNALAYHYATNKIHLVEAATLIEQALQLEPYEAQYMDTKGWLQFLKKDYINAQLFLEKAYHLKKDPNIAAHLIEALWIQGKQQQSVEIWKESSIHNPDNPALNATLQRLGINPQILTKDFFLAQTSQQEKASLPAEPVKLTTALPPQKPILQENTHITNTANSDQKTTIQQAPTIKPISTQALTTSTVSKTITKVLTHTNSIAKPIASPTITKATPQTASMTKSVTTPTVSKTTTKVITHTNSIAKPTSSPTITKAAAQTASMTKSVTTPTVSKTTTKVLTHTNSIAKPTASPTITKATPQTASMTKSVTTPTVSKTTTKVLTHTNSIAKPTVSSTITKATPQTASVTKSVTTPTVTKTITKVLTQTNSIAKPIDSPTITKATPQTASMTKSVTTPTVSKTTTKVITHTNSIAKPTSSPTITKATQQTTSMTKSVTTPTVSKTITKVLTHTNSIAKPTASPTITKATPQTASMTKSVTTPTVSKTTTKVLTQTNSIAKPIASPTITKATPQTASVTKSVTTPTVTKTITKVLTQTNSIAKPTSSPTITKATQQTTSMTKSVTTPTVSKTTTKVLTHTNSIAKPTASSTITKATPQTASVTKSVTTPTVSKTTTKVLTHTNSIAKPTSSPTITKAAPQTASVTKSVTTPTVTKTITKVLTQTNSIAKPIDSPTITKATPQTTSISGGATHTNTLTHPLLKSTKTISIDDREKKPKPLMPKKPVLENNLSSAALSTMHTATKVTATHIAPIYGYPHGV